MKKPSPKELEKIETSFKRMNNRKPLADEIREMLYAKGLKTSQVESLVTSALNLGWQDLTMEQLKSHVEQLVSLSNI